MFKVSREKVAAGIALLDAKFPDWRDRIDPAKLDMGAYHRRDDGCGCLMVQLSGGNYWAGLALLGIGTGSLYGFDLPCGNYTKDEQKAGYAVLTDYWRGELEEVGPAISSRRFGNEPYEYEV
jgi:hypothetical protein